MRERGVIGWVVLIVLAIVIALIFGLCKLVIPGDGEDHSWSPSSSLSQASLFWHLYWRLRRPKRRRAELSQRVDAKAQADVQRLRALYERDKSAYYRTPHWQDLRAIIRARDHNQCQTCWLTGAEATLDVHHRTYQRVGCEWLTDLILLCQDCHKAIHDHVWRPRKRAKDRQQATALRLVGGERVDERHGVAGDDLDINVNGRAVVRGAGLQAHHQDGNSRP